MRDCFRDVLEFHRTMGCAIGSAPAVPDRETIQLRRDLIGEEVGELLEALVAGDLPGIADGAVDAIYVIVGTLIACGIDPAPIWAAVHASNIAKAGGPKRADGKCLKPPGWRPPDVAGILAAQPPITIKEVWL